MNDVGSRTCTRPTEEQEAILNFVRYTFENLMISALAGTGKTKTLEMVDEATPGPNLLVCFNKSVADEAREKFRPTTTVKNLNSLGHGIWGGACAKRLSLNNKKISDIFKSIAADMSRAEREEMWKNYDIVINGVNLAKAIGYIPIHHAKYSKALATWDNLIPWLDERPTQDTKEWIDHILNISISWAYDGIIDFADQLYMPALFGGTYPRFPLVLIDEYQDLSPVNHAMVAKLCRHSRQIGVGDEAQAIYGFRGANEAGMSDAETQFQMVKLPLTTSFRCPSLIVENVRWRVPGFRASREGGTVDKTTCVTDDSAVICRNNAPLLALAMKLLAKGRRVDVGGVDIGTRIVRLLQNLGPEDMSQASALGALDGWLAFKLANGSKSATDMAECMRVFILKATNLGQAIAYARHLLAQSGTVRFLTGHKAKGLEFDHVYHLDQHLIRDSGQDPNVRYVIDTRSKEALSYIDSRTVQ